MVKYKRKAYTHFDDNIDVERVKRLIENPKYILRHKFYPLIKYSLQTIKYAKEEDTIEKIKKLKNRPISYASHVDRYIYQYYANYYNKMLNRFLESKKIDESVVAYRLDRSFSNITVANDVFNFIISTESSNIYVGDFKSFFDSLGHTNLKNRIKKISIDNCISQDEYKIYKSITKYSYFEMTDIEKYYIDKGLSKKQIKKLPRYFPDNFNQIKNKYIKKYSDLSNDRGIPQGTPLSGVMANIYMIEFDAEMEKFAATNQGIYRRYSDDFILVVNDSCSLDKVSYLLSDLLDRDQFLKIEETKSIKLKYREKSFFDSDSNKANLTYLGFSFDGEKVKIRDSSITNYFSKLNRFITKEIQIEKRKKKTNPKYTRSSRKAYIKYGVEGSYGYKIINNEKVKNRNFLSYVKRCGRVMGEKFDDNNLLKRANLIISETYVKQRR